MYRNRRDEETSSHLAKHFVCYRGHEYKILMSQSLKKDFNTYESVRGEFNRSFARFIDGDWGIITEEQGGYSLRLGWTTAGYGTPKGVIVFYMNVDNGIIEVSYARDLFSEDDIELAS